MRFSLIGPGRVGLSVGHALLEANFELVAIVAKSFASATRAAGYLGSGQARPEIDEACAAVDLIIVATPDDVIGQVAYRLAPYLRQRGQQAAGTLVCHTSGATSVEALAPVIEAGALAGSIHPLQTFARRWPPEALAGCAMTVEAEGAALERCLDLVHALNGRPLRLRPGRKAHYHAAASMVSNHLVGLLDLGLSLMRQAGLNDEEGLEALLPLIRRTVNNSSAGPDQALTGPIERGDVGTVRAHLQSLSRLAAGDGDDGRLILQAYRTLGLAALQVARRKHGNGNANFDRIEHLLRGNNNIV